MERPLLKRLRDFFGQEYERSTANRILTVTKIATNIVIHALPSPIYGNTPFIVSGFLAEKGELWEVWTRIPNATIYLFYNGTRLTTTVTDEDGNWSAEVSIPTAGVYRIRAEYHGDEQYMETWHATPEFTVEVGLYPTLLTIEAPETVEKNEEFTITGKLAREDTGEGLSGMTVDIRVDDTTVGRPITDADGNYSSVAISIPTIGEHTLQSTFEGAPFYGQMYAPTTTSLKVTVGKIVCQNNPRLATLYQCAKELGFIRLSDNIEKACEYLEAE